jgi:hypothetical protein
MGKVGTLAVVALALTVPAAASARWSRPQTVAGQQVFGAPVVATNQRGDAILAWTDRHGVKVAFAHHGQAFGKPRLVPASDVAAVPAPVVAALDDSGLALVAWTDCVGDFEEPGHPGATTCQDEVRGSFRRAGKPHFRRAKTLSKRGREASAPQVAARGGHATVAFADADGGSVLAVRAGRHGFTRRRKITYGEPGAEPAVTIAPDGTETFFSVVSLGIRAVERLSSGAIRYADEVTGSTPYYNLIARAGAPGEQAAVWDSEGSGGSSLRAGVRRDGHGMRVRRISTPGGGLYDSALAGASSGWFIAAFGKDRPSGVLSHRIRYSLRAPGGRFGPSHPIAGAATEAGPDVAIDRQGRVLAAWLDYSGGFVQAAASSPRGRRLRAGRDFALWSDADPTCHGDDDRVCTAPRVAFDGRGRGYMTWLDGNLVRAARYQPPR